MPHAQLNSWLSEWGQVWKLPQLPDRVRVEFNSRIRRSLGRCRPRDGQIQLHPALLKDPPDSDGNTSPYPALLREVLCHEAAHVAAFLLHGVQIRPHGAEWADLMRIAGYHPRVKMDPAALPDEFRQAIQPRVLYRHHCPVCGAERLARRPVRRWRCRACHDAGLEGHLEIVKGSSLVLMQDGRSAPD